LLSPSTFTAASRAPTRSRGLIGRVFRCRCFGCLALRYDGSTTTRAAVEHTTSGLQTVVDTVVDLVAECGIEVGRQPVAELIVLLCRSLLTQLQVVHPECSYDGNAHQRQQDTER